MPLCKLTLEEELVELIERYQLSYMTSLAAQVPPEPLAEAEEELVRLRQKLQIPPEPSNTKVKRKFFPLKLSN